MPNEVCTTVGRVGHSRLLFTTVSLALFMGAVDQTMVATALVAIVRTRSM